jgi:hypothetical protein
MLLFQLDWPALLAGCGPPESDGKSLMSKLARASTGGSAAGLSGGLSFPLWAISAHDSFCGVAIASSCGSCADHASKWWHGQAPLVISCQRTAAIMPSLSLHALHSELQAQTTTAIAMFMFMFMHPSTPAHSPPATTCIHPQTRTRWVQTHLISIGACDPPPPIT